MILLGRVLVLWKCYLELLEWLEILLVVLT